MLIHNTQAYLFRVEREARPLMRKGPDGKPTPVVEHHPKTGEAVMQMRVDPAVAIIPGISRVSADEWDSIESSEGVRMRLRGASLDGTAIPDGASLRVISKTDDLPKTQVEAIALIALCFDVELLQDWEKTATGRVREEIGLQILKMTNPDQWEEKSKRAKESRR